MNMTDFFNVLDTHFYTNITWWFKWRTSLISSTWNLVTQQTKQENKEIQGFHQTMMAGWLSGILSKRLKNQLQLLELRSCRTFLVRADPCLPWVAPTKASGSSELDNGAMDQWTVTMWRWLPGEGPLLKDSDQSEVFRSMFCWECLGSAFHVHLTLSHLPKHCCRPCSHFKGNFSDIPWCLFQQNYVPCLKLRWFRNGLRSPTRRFRCTWPPNYPDVKPFEHVWDGV